MAEDKKTTSEKTGLSFKEKPLVRSGNILYYGVPTDRFVTRLEIMETKKENAEDIPSKVTVELLDGIDSKKPRAIMQTERTSLYDALDIAWIWMERAQAEMQA